MAYWDPLLEADLRLTLIRAQIVECAARGVSRASYAPSLLWDLADAMAGYDADGARFLMGLPLPDQAKVNLDNILGEQFAECYFLLTDTSGSLGKFGAGVVEEPPEVPEERPEPAADAEAAESAAADATFADSDAQFWREARQAWDQTATDKTGQMRNNALRAAQRRYANRLAEESFKTSVRTQAKVDELVRRTELDDVRNGKRSEAEDKASLGSRIWGSVMKHPWATVLFGVLLVGGLPQYLLNQLFLRLFGVQPFPPSPRCSMMSTPYGTIIGGVIGVGAGWLFSRYLAEEF